MLLRKKIFKDFIHELRNSNFNIINNESNLEPSVRIPVFLNATLHFSVLDLSPGVGEWEMKRRQEGSALFGR